MKITRISSFLVLALCMMVLVVMCDVSSAYAAGIKKSTKKSAKTKAKTETTQTVSTKGKDFTITPSSEPVNPKMLRYGFYNKYTRQYYTIRSYMELFEKKGGGTLTLKKGTYNITNTIFIPSNVTIIMEKGVVINKSKNTHAKGLKASNSLFHFIKPSKGLKSNVYGKYDSSKNVKMIGKGNPVVDMKYQTNSNCIEAGHNTNVTIKGITFKNVHGGHFIEMDANKNAKIENCRFLNIKDSRNVREAINLDTPDKVTGGFTAQWSKMDKTPNQKIVIRNCTFNNMPRAIGTHNYSEGYIHKNITITDNTIEKVKGYGIGVMNWRGFKITGNKITGSYKNGKNKFDGILVFGSANGQVTGNTLVNFRYPILCKDYDDPDHSVYGPIYINFTDEQKKMLRDNYAKKVKFNHALIQEDLRGHGFYKAFVKMI